MGTELRFLRQVGVEGFEDTVDAEYWHGKALEIAVRFLPGDAPLTKHIVSSYSKHHSPAYEQIPEDQEIESDLRVIKPFKGLESDKQCPLIKDIGAPSVKLSPLDLAPNDYITVLLDHAENNISKSQRNSNFTTNPTKQSKKSSKVQSTRVEKIISDFKEIK